MDYKVIGDSCCDYTEEMKLDPHFTIVPLTLEIGTYMVTDDDTFDQKDFIAKMKASPIGPKTACPSPEAYKEAIEQCDAEEAYIVTLSEHLSGSYQAAIVGAQMYEEEHPEESRIKVHVFGSDSAAAGQLNICLFIRDLKAQGKAFADVVKETAEHIYNMQTYFVLESLDNLRKNGRLSGIKSIIASALNIKPVMAGNHGVIVQLDNQRGINKALKRMAELAVSRLGGPEKAAEHRLVITHVDNAERAEFVKSEFLKRAPFKEVVIANSMGVATIYADDGGIVVGV